MTRKIYLTNKNIGWFYLHSWPLKSNVRGRGKEQLDSSIIQYIKAKCFLYYKSKGNPTDEWEKCVQSIDVKSRAIKQQRKRKGLPEQLWNLPWLLIFCTYSIIHVRHVKHVTCFNIIMYPSLYIHCTYYIHHIKCYPCVSVVYNNWLIMLRKLVHLLCSASWDQSHGH